ncbi:MAG: IS1634 family transposase, partial [Candidatus Dojkabacteria bacterium]
MFLRKKTIKGRAYYYLAKSGRVNGKPRVIWEKYLGSAESLVHLLEQGVGKPKKVASLEYGSVAALNQIAKEIGLVKTIDEVVPKKKIGLSIGTYILLASLNRAIEPKSKASLQDWYKKTGLKELMPVSFKLLASQNFWDNFDLIKEKHLTEILIRLNTSIMKEHHLSLDTLLYDTTNFYTYFSTTNKSRLAQKGASKEKRTDLRQIGVALLTSRPENIPLFFKVYPGNIHDSKLFRLILKQMIGLLRKLKPEEQQLTLVFDKGNNSSENIAIIREHKCHFVGSLSPYHHQDLMCVDLEEFSELPEQQDVPQKDRILFYREQFYWYGKLRTVVVTFNPSVYRCRMHTLAKEIARTKTKITEEIKEVIRKYQKYPDALKRIKNHVKGIMEDSGAGKFFRAHIYSRYSSIDYKLYLKEKEMDIRKNKAGKNIIVTDQEGWSAKDIWAAYRDRYLVEDHFKQLKDPFQVSIRPIFCWTDSKIRVHILVCYLALLLLSLLREKLRKEGLVLSVDK